MVVKKKYKCLHTGLNHNVFNLVERTVNCKIFYLVIRVIRDKSLRDILVFITLLCHKSRLGPRRGVWKIILLLQSHSIFLRPLLIIGLARELRSRKKYRGSTIYPSLSVPSLKLTMCQVFSLGIVTLLMKIMIFFFYIIGSWCVLLPWFTQNKKMYKFDWLFLFTRFYLILISWLVNYLKKKYTKNGLFCIDKSY